MRRTASLGIESGLEGVASSMRRAVLADCADARSLVQRGAGGNLVRGHGDSSVYLGRG